MRLWHDIAHCNPHGACRRCSCLQRLFLLHPCHIRLLELLRSCADSRHNMAGKLLWALPLRIPDIREL